MIVAWGTDFVYERSRVDKSFSWTNHGARRYMASKGDVHNSLQLRRNSYRVLLTRGRPVTFVSIPQLPELDRTYEFLLASGFVGLV